MNVLYNTSINRSLRKKLRSDATKSEMVLWKYLKGKQIGFKFRRQFGVGPYIVDFYCPAVRLAIEVDGLSHLSETVFENDVKRQKYLEHLGITVKRYQSGEVFGKLTEILEEFIRRVIF